MSGVSLNLSDYIGRGKCWMNRDEQMNMIGHYFNLNHLKIANRKKNDRKSIASAWSKVRAKNKMLTRFVLTIFSST